jgi:two-component system, OmpR family, sensor kinase
MRSGGRMRLLLSLRNRLAFVFFGVTFIAIAALYLYVAPGLKTRLLDERLNELSAAATHYSDRFAEMIDSSAPVSAIRREVDDAAAASGYRVTLLLISRTFGAPLQLTAQADSSSPAAAQALHFTTAYRTARTGRLATGTESGSAGSIAEAAYPIPFQGRVGAVLVYSSQVDDIVHNVSIVRHEILVAGGIALLLALIGGYLVARWLALRVKRLERAAEQVAAGDFEHPIAVDSTDELGQLAVAFNDMQRQLSDLESARKKFIATASHELRTPLFSLGGFVELLEDDDLDPETRRRFLDQVRDQVERLRKLSVDLLDLSKLDAGSLELRPEQVDLGELTRSVSGEFEPTLAQHDSDLEVRLPARSIDTVCDPVRVAQIIRILIDNALTHTPPGTRIVVTALRENGSVRLAVRDDGGGIDDRSVRRIFEPFYTADDAQGSGLGLAIASELAERMAGRLTVRSAPGDTVFTLELPSS